jgi:hypothetical protein
MRNPNNFEKKVKKKCTNSVSTHPSTIYIIRCRCFSKSHPKKGAAVQTFVNIKKMYYLCSEIKINDA